jgi:HTH/TPR domain-containing protein
MAETMGEIIRKLRRERNLTQEELAEQIGVTYQAVSKWENNTGLPDISQVVPLANYFGVSTDTLFNYCSADKKKEFEEYKQRANKLRNKGKLCEEIELWREASKKYPGEYECISELSTVLLNRIFISGHDHKLWEADAFECLNLCEKILNGCTKDYIRDTAIQNLTYLYSIPYLSIANEEKAVEYAEMASCIWCSCEMLLENAYFTERGKVKAREIRDCNILTFMDYICMKLTLCFELSDEEQIRNNNAALILWKTLIPDDNYLFYHCRIADIQKNLAKCYARKNQKAETINSLQLAAYHAKSYDSIPVGEQHYTSPLVAYATSDESKSMKNYQGTDYELFLQVLKEPCFDFIRDEPEFIALSE